MSYEVNWHSDTLATTVAVRHRRLSLRRRVVEVLSALVFAPATAWMLGFWAGDPNPGHFAAVIAVVSIAGYFLVLMDRRKFCLVSFHEDEIVYVCNGPNGRVSETFPSDHAEAVVHGRWIDGLALASRGARPILVRGVPRKQQHEVATRVGGLLDVPDFHYDGFVFIQPPLDKLQSGRT